MILEEMPLKGVMDFQDLIWDTDWAEGDNFLALFRHPFCKLA